MKLEARKQYSVGRLGFDPFGVHLLEFQAVEVEWESVGHADLMRGLHAQRPAHRLGPIGVFVPANSTSRSALQKTILNLWLHSIYRNNGRPDVAMHVFRLAGLDGDFQQADVVVLEENFVVFRRSTDSFHGFWPMPNDPSLALRPRSCYEGRCNAADDCRDPK